MVDGGHLKTQHFMNQATVIHSLKKKEEEKRKAVVFVRYLITSFSFLKVSFYGLRFRM